MKPKLIKSILYRKIKAWADSVRKEGNTEIAKIIENETVVMGGSICSLLTNQKPNDYDVYFRTQKGAKKVAKYYIEKFLGRSVEDKENDFNLSFVDDPKGLSLYIKSFGKAEKDEEEHRENETGESELLASQVIETTPSEVMEQYFGEDVDENSAASVTMDDKDKQNKDDKPKFRPRFLTSNAITLSDDIQIVLRFCGEPEEILEYYDYEHCKMWYSAWDKNLELPQRSLECLLNKRLVYSGSKFPICSLFRMRKFLARGFSIDAGQIVKMSWQISQLNLYDIETLHQQLIGCDHSFFQSLIDRLKRETENKNEEESRDFIGNYLIDLIEEIFGD